MSDDLSAQSHPSADPQEGSPDSERATLVEYRPLEPGAEVHLTGRVFWIGRGGKLETTPSASPTPQPA